MIHAWRYVTHLLDVLVGRKVHVLEAIGGTDLKTRIGHAIGLQAPASQHPVGMGTHPPTLPPTPCLPSALPLTHSPNQSCQHPMGMGNTGLCK